MKKIISVLLVISLIVNGWLFYRNRQYQNEISNSILRGLTIAMLDLKQLESYNSDNFSKFNKTNIPLALLNNIKGIEAEFKALFMLDQFSSLSNNFKSKITGTHYIFDMKYVPMVNRIVSDNIISDEEKVEIDALSNRINKSLLGTVIEYKEESNNVDEILQKIENDLERFIEFDD